MSLPMPGVAEDLGGRDGEGMGNTFESFGVPESDRVKKDLTIGAALEGEPGSMLILWIDHGNLLMLVGFSMTVHLDSDRSLLVLDHQVDPFIELHGRFRLRKGWPIRQFDRVTSIL